MINDLLVTSAFHECRLDTSHSNRSCSYLLYFLLQTPPGTPTEAEMNAGDYPGDGSNLDYGREISNKVMSGELTFSSHQVPKKSAHVKVRTARPQIVRYPSSHIFLRSFSSPLCFKMDCLTWFQLSLPLSATVARKVHRSWNLPHHGGPGQNHAG